jgi:hypothetical protein
VDADDAPASEARAQADAEFNLGKKLMDDGNVSAACAKFAHSQELDPKLGRLLNLAFCHEQEGKTASAWSEYNGAAALAEQKGQAERVSFAREHAASVAKKLAFVHLDVPANAATLEVDGAGIARDKWPNPIPFDPGEHKLVVTAPGKKDIVSVFVVGTTPGMTDFHIAPLADEGETPAPAETTAPPASPSPAQAPSAAAPAETAPAPSTGPNRVPALAVAGGAGAALVVGTVFGLEAMSKRNDANSAGCVNKSCDSRGSSLISQAKTFATVSTIGFAVGLAGAGAATWLFVKPPGGDATSARLFPVVGREMAGLGMQGAW